MKSHEFSWFFFFSSRRRHTRSLRDWSSDVCSSDLRTKSGLGPFRPLVDPGALYWIRRPELTIRVAGAEIADRSEERRVGKECRSRGSRYREKKKAINRTSTEVKDYPSQD